MRRGRSWSGGGGSREPYRGGGGAGYGHNRPRGFFSSGPPRINRPPWPRPPGPPHIRPGGPSDKFYNKEGPDNFGPRNFNSSQRGFHHGPPRFQRGGLRGAHTDHQRNVMPFLDRPPPNFVHGSSNPNQHSTKNSKQNVDEYHQSSRESHKDTFHRGISPSEFTQKETFDRCIQYNKGKEKYHKPPDYHAASSTTRQIFAPSLLGIPKSHSSRPPLFEDYERNSEDRKVKENYNSEQRFQKPDFTQPPPNYKTKHLDMEDYPNSESDQRRKSCENSSIEFSPKSNRNIEVWDTRHGFVTQQEYSGQRPPATDHYTDRSGSVDDGYYKSIGDTVDIIKKRLKNRQDNPTPQRQSIDTDDTHWNDRGSPVKKEKSHRSSSHREDRHHRRTKCEKKCARMKKKIVRQLFKMDKSALHKFVDDPQSSAKFEYALNSLITESRNSMNRQMRAAAEKSLGGSSCAMDHRVGDDSVYEDTFMAQMQGVLDPHDIIMLSDIKPMVMAEINRVLQIDEYGQPYSEDDDRYHTRTHLDSYDSSDPLEVPMDTAPINIDDEVIDEDVCFSDEDKKTRELNYHQSIPSHENIKHIDNAPEEEICKFPDNLESLSDDDYNFAEFDKQYHVAVEYSMIEQAGKSPTSPVLSLENKKQIEAENNCFSDHSPPGYNKIEHHITISGITTNDEKETELCKNNLLDAITKIEDQPKKQVSEVNIVRKEITSVEDSAKGLVKTEVKENKNLKLTNEDFNIVEPTKSLPNSANKRESDEKISHRKEKRKKFDTKLETNKKVLNKNIIINVNDCASNNSEKCDSGPKSVFNLFFSKSDGDKARDDSKRADGVNISYSDKYVKRKISTDKNMDPKKTTSNVLNKSGSKDNTNINQQCTKLQTIDMFEQLPKKPAHIAIRNTAINSTHPEISESNQHNVKPIKPAIVKKGSIKEIPMAKNLMSNYTQTFIKQHARSTQTKDQTTKKMTSIGCQTDVDCDVNPGLKSVRSEDVMERMKQIDLEIQQLLQEKFKLYKNLESSGSEINTMQSLGMAVVNMESNLNSVAPHESGLIDTFTNMSEEDLQDIAFQEINDSVLETEIQTNKTAALDTKKRKYTKKHTKGVAKKKKNVPKMVLKLNKKQKQFSSESQDEYKVVKSQKKHKKVTFQLGNPDLHLPYHRKAYNTSMSLIDQIINDNEELNLDEIEDYETVNPSKFSIKKKGKIKKSTNKEMEVTKLSLNECFVVLNKITLNARLQKQLMAITSDSSKNYKAVDNIQSAESEEKVLQIEETEQESLLGDISLADFGVELHDDMLEVSEDIVIDDVGGGVDLILADPECDVVDNRPVQEETVKSTISTEECMVYDFSPNGEYNSEIISLSGHADAIVAMETVDDDIVAASLDGNVYHYSGRDGRLLTTLRGSNFALTCLAVGSDKYGTTVYTGCLDSRIRYYDLATGLEKGPECNVLSAIQSMDRAWDTVFVGTRTGFVLQFQCKNNLLIPVSSLKFSEQTILSLRALREGPRRVLLVGPRGEGPSLRDARSGLLLRTLDGPAATAYSLLHTAGRLYCGTTGLMHVYDFTSGASVCTPSGARGAVSLRAAGGLVLAGCHDGSVYVYRPAAPAPFARLQGPREMLLSLAVLHTKIIASYKNKSLYIWKIPSAIVQEMVL